MGETLPSASAALGLSCEKRPRDSDDADTERFNPVCKKVAMPAETIECDADTWSCLRCTFINSALLTSCEMCELSRSSPSPIPSCMSRAGPVFESLRSSQQHGQP